MLLNDLTWKVVVIDEKNIRMPALMGTQKELVKVVFGRAKASVALMSAERSVSATRLPNAFQKGLYWFIFDKYYHNKIISL